MKFIEDWKLVLWASWSVRATLVLGILDAINEWLPLIVSFTPPGWYAAIRAPLYLSAVVLRVVYQPSLHKDEATK
jgi:hypothetical protein